MRHTARYGSIVVGMLMLAPRPAAAQEMPIVWSKPDTFWYRKALPTGNVWINIDARHGVKEPLFDHQRLAIELNIRTGYEFTPLTLPLADPAAQFVVKYDGSNAYIQQGAMAIEFVLDGNHWRCELQVKWDWNKVPPTDYECTSRRPVVAGQPPVVARPTTTPPRVSPDGRWEAVVEGHNVVVRPVGAAGKSIALSTDGAAGFAYDPASIRWSDDATTVSAYRVSSKIWESDGVTGSVKGLVARGEWKAPR
jgi:hypothetical protein